MTPAAALNPGMTTGCHTAEVDVVDLAHAVRRSLADGEPVGDALRLVRQFIMDLEAAEDGATLFAQNPPSSGDARWDALIAGVVEDFALHHGLPAPSWVFDPSRYLSRWWFVTSFISMRPTAIVETPAALSGRGVFIQRASLVNV
jgi:hypothetical protein